MAGEEWIPKYSSRCFLGGQLRGLITWGTSGGLPVLKPTGASQARTMAGGIPSARVFSLDVSNLRHASSRSSARGLSVIDVPPYPNPDESISTRCQHPALACVSPDCDIPVSVKPGGFD